MFMWKLKKVVAILILSALSLDAAYADKVKDKHIFLSYPSFCKGLKEHENLVNIEKARLHQCKAIQFFNEKKYKTALKEFYTSHSIQVHEVPNFENLSFIALSQYFSDQRENATKTIVQAWLSIMIYAGKIKCHETIDFSIQQSFYLKNIDTKSIDIVAKLMCSPFYLGYYGDGKKDAFDQLKFEVNIYSIAAAIIPNSLPSFSKVNS